MKLSAKTIEALADRGLKQDGPRCTFTSGAVRCCREPHEDGPHSFKCASETCPGYPWKASNSPHPCAP